ncbi:hypothetical protein [Brevibacillus migulae]|uniref:hypothetical protein n=1 Tax=Brevibacillus migulae TaxID=1644114 RepID=UPI00106DD7E6|nr:hypothetical protein [Brevibacillus migulae]
MRQMLIDFLNKQHRILIDTRDMETYIKMKAGSEYGGWAIFAQEIKKLESEGMLRPVISRKLLCNETRIYRCYRMIRSHPELMNASSTMMEYAQLPDSWHPKMAKEYYQNHLEEVRRDWKLIEPIDRFFKELQEKKEGMKARIPHRSYQLFRDQELLGKPRMQLILRKLNLTYEDLGCTVASDPFVYHVIKVQEKNSVLIVDDKHTFLYVRSAFERNDLHGLPEINLLILFEEHNRTTSLSYFQDLAAFHGKEAEFWYFSDIEPRKIVEWKKLHDHYQDYQIRPYLPFYERLLNQYLFTAPPLKRKSIESAEMREALALFPRTFQEKIRLLFQAKRYIPQAAFTLE